LNRPVSPLLHDYKPSALRQPAKSKALQWFAVGLGIPLIAVTLMNTLDQPALQEPVSSPPIMSSSPDEPPIVPPVDQAALIEELTALLPEPAPEFDKLVLNIKSGDTMEKLFRQNNLSLGHLMSIAELDEAKTRFRRIKPGDVFETNKKQGLQRRSLIAPLRYENEWLTVSSIHLCLKVQPPLTFPTRS